MERRRKRRFFDMGYLQDGICFSTVGEAKKDFVSRVIGVSQRQEAIQQVNAMSTAEIKGFFPECRTPVETYAMYQAALLSVVVFLLVSAWVKKVAML